MGLIRKVKKKCQVCWLSPEPMMVEEANFQKREKGNEK
jgi:hypothetical protein